MDACVVGTPITISTLEGMPEYAGRYRKDRAHVALNMKSAEEKHVIARNYVERKKAKWGTGVSTLCLVYNATGDTVTRVPGHDWYGHIEDQYPEEIANGQWGGYLHVKKSEAPSGSCAAVVYRGKNEAGAECDWMLAWSNPWGLWFENKAYTEIREAHHFEGNVWDTISDTLSNSGLEHRDEWNGCSSSVKTGSATSPIFEAILTLTNAAA